MLHRSDAQEAGRYRNAAWEVKVCVCNFNKDILKIQCLIKEPFQHFLTINFLHPPLFQDEWDSVPRNKLSDPSHCS
jgi:hypothetical protein